MKVPILERNNQLRAKTDKEPSKLITEEQIPISFSGIGSIHKVLSQAGTFVCPHNCVVRNFSARVTINKAHSFQVLLRDANENEVSNNLEQLDIQVQYYNAARHTITPKIEEKSNGYYKVSYTPSNGGEHKVSISIGNQPIPGIPF